MSKLSLRKAMFLFAGSLLLAGCPSSGGSSKSTLDSMSETQRKAKMEETIQQTMDKNKEAMEKQGMTAPPGTSGFQPPESMKKYTNKQGGGAGTSAPGGATGTATPPKTEGGGAEPKKE